VIIVTVLQLRYIITLNSELKLSIDVVGEAIARLYVIRQGDILVVLVC
jgi:hypothetical protein